MTDPRFSHHNLHLEGIDVFDRRDPQLSRLTKVPLIFESPLILSLPSKMPGIYTLSGGRQIGKTTLIKQWMLHLLKSGVASKKIAFFTGELIDDHHSLLLLLQQQLENMEGTGLKFLVLDEVTYIKDWDKAVKFAADSGMLHDVVLILTGSDLRLIKESRMRFPGRRGQSAQVDYHLFPLSFREYFELKEGSVSLYLDAKQADLSSKEMDLLYSAFNRYLLHGGFMTAINDIERTGSVLEATLATYSDWIRGDMIKSGKKESYLRELLAALIKSGTSQVTWNSLSKNLSIDHPSTVADYIFLLESMDALFVQAALVEDKLVGAPKKARKIGFADPFVYHAVRAWTNPVKNPFEDQMQSSVTDPIISSCLVETCVASHYRRHYPTYYIKAEGEVDIAYVDQGQFFPVEVKWTGQIKSSDLKQVRKYPNGRILSKQRNFGCLDNLSVEPLPIALLSL